MRSIERIFEKYLPTRITNIILAGQILSYIFIYVRPDYSRYLDLFGFAIYKGEVWRLITFLFMPTGGGFIVTLFAWYFFYIFSNALETRWGSFRYLIYLGIAYILTVCFALVFPGNIYPNSYLYLSLFLAFAHLYPEVVLYIFFIIPLKVKWLGWLAWIYLGMLVLFNNLTFGLFILCSIANFFIFFYHDLRFTAKSLLKSKTGHLEYIRHTGKPLHICAICGKNEVTDPDMQIRYCSQCSPVTCYCGEHIKNHQHKRLVN